MKRRISSSIRWYRCLPCRRGNWRLAQLPCPAGIHMDAAAVSRWRRRQGLPRAGGIQMDGRAASRRRRRQGLPRAAGTRAAAPAPSSSLARARRDLRRQRGGLPCATGMRATAPASRSAPSPARSLPRRRNRRWLAESERRRQATCSS